MSRYIPADLRQLVIERSRECCEYCRIHQSDNSTLYHIEHIIARSHGGKTESGNLAYSCSHCNLFKGTNIAAADPNTGQPTFLFHPRLDVWEEHFRLDKAMIVPLTPEGRATILVLHLNDWQRVEQRSMLIQIGRYPCLQP